MANKKRRKAKDALSFSADYRSGSSRPVASDDPAVSRETVQERERLQDRDDIELDDFLPEGETLPDDDMLSKWRDESAAAAQKATDRTSRPRGKRRYGVLLGSVVLLLALVGVVSLAGMIGTQIYSSVTDDSALRAYDEQLACVVMQDPEPFDSPETADPLFVQNAALWKSILEKRSEWTGYDDAGLAVIPLGVVAASAREIFGSDFTLSPLAPTEETFYTYDSADNTYHVSVFSNDSAMTPYVEKSRTENGMTVLTVGYVLPTDPYRTDASESAPTPSKTMEYVMRTDEETGEPVLYAVREPA